MSKITLEEIIRNHVHLGRPNPQGWCPVLCKVCHDHGKKGPRAAFKFEGDTVGYHCFNCSHSTVYDPNVSRSMPRKMLEVMDAYGIPDSDWRVVIFQNLNRERSNGEKQEQYVSIEPAAIELPQCMLKLGVGTSSSDDVAEYAKEYLEGRGVDWKTYPFYIARNDGSAQSKKWFGRLIIPIYKENKLVYYQGRDLTGIATQKYLSPNVPHDNVIYGYENLHTDPDEPLYVLEGWFDAFLLGGVAVFGNKFSDAQIKWLNQSRRKKVVIPDRFGDGHKLAEAAINLGWSVSTPDAPGCKDVTDIVKKYGMLYALKTIHDNTAEGFAAEVKLAVYRRS